MPKQKPTFVIRSADGSISIGNRAPLRQKGSSNTNIAPKVKNSTNSKLEVKIEAREGFVSITLPIRTKSEANSFEHWTVPWKRHAAQKQEIYCALKPIRSKIKLPCSIVFTRYAPTKFDRHDNLPTSFKYIVDAVCAVLTGDYRAGRADSDERISIAYGQIQSKLYGIKIEITSSSLPNKDDKHP